MSASGLRKEAAKGRLTIERIAGKDFVTLAAIQSMRNLCQIRRRASDFGSGQPEGEKKPRGSSETDQSNPSLDAAMATARRLSRNSPTTSAPNTGQSARGDLDTASVPIADVLNIYMTDKAPSVVSGPSSLASASLHCWEFFSGRKLGEINGALCRAYAERRGSQSMARRELGRFEGCNQSPPSRGTLQRDRRGYPASQVAFAGNGGSPALRRLRMNLGGLAVSRSPERQRDGPATFSTPRKRN